MRIQLVVLFTITALQGAAFAKPSPEKQLFLRGKTSFYDGDYATAVARWKEAYTLSEEPELLFLIAQALGHLDGRCAEALATCRRFITIAPGSKHRPDADEFVRRMTASCDAVKTAPREKESIEEPVEHHHDVVENDNETHLGGLQIAGLTAVGVGAVSVAAGIYFGYRASSLADEVTNRCSATEPCKWSTVKDKDAAGHRDATLGRTLDALGAVALVGGAALYYLGVRANEIHISPLAKRPHESGAVLTWGRNW